MIVRIRGRDSFPDETPPPRDRGWNEKHAVAKLFGVLDTPVINTHVLVTHTSSRAMRSVGGGASETATWHARVCRRRRHPDDYVFITARETADKRTVSAAPSVRRTSFSFSSLPRPRPVRFEMKLETTCHTTDQVVYDTHTRNVCRYARSTLLQTVCIQLL